MANKSNDLIPIASSWNSLSLPQKKDLILLLSDLVHRQINRQHLAGGKR